MMNEDVNESDIKKYLDLIYKMRSNCLCKANLDDYLVYRKDWLHKHLEQEFELQKEVRRMNEKLKEENKK